MTIVYLALAAYLPISRRIQGEASTRTRLDEWDGVAWALGPLYVFGMLPIAVLPVALCWALVSAQYGHYSASVLIGAGISYLVYALYPARVKRPPLPTEDVPRFCLEVAYRARSEYNPLPSGHALYTLLNAIFVAPLLSPLWGGVWVFCSVLIVAAAWLTRLHNALDIIAGLALGAAAYFFAGWLVSLP